MGHNSSTGEGGQVPWRLVQDWDKEGLQGGSGSSGSHAGSSGSHGGAAPVALALGPKKKHLPGGIQGSTVQDELLLLGGSGEMGSGAGANRSQDEGS